MLIYKIFLDAEWEALRLNGTTSGAPIDKQDGYIHFSTTSQVPETVAKYFSGRSDLWILAVDTEAIVVSEELKWEKSRNNELFPHLYRELRISDVVWAKKISLSVDGSRHEFPPEMI
jgi:uncharacterized protein (DUF952 family)